MSYLTAAEFGSKYRSKLELERFLRMEMKAHLPEHKYCTAFFYRSLLSGDAKVSLYFQTFRSQNEIELIRLKDIL
jgi:hypothetical protein